MLRNIAICTALIWSSLAWGAHFYTVNPEREEMNTAYRLEGIEGFVYKDIGTTDLDLVPVFRARRDWIDDWFYTADLSEAKNAAEFGYRVENEGKAVFYCHAKQRKNTKPLLRYFSPGGNGAAPDHFYTTNPPSDGPFHIGYRQEGTLCWIGEANGSALTPLYRYFPYAAHEDTDRAHMPPASPCRWTDDQKHHTVLQCPGAAPVPEFLGAKP